MSEEILLGRQPVVDRSGALVAYELLFRSADEAGPAANAERPTDDLRASSHVMTGALIDIGLADSLGPHSGFVNANHLLLMDDVVSVLPPERFVLEVLETTVVDAPLHDRLAELRALGYRLALEDVASLDDPRLALPLVDVVKVDLLLAGAEGASHLARELAPSGKTLLAEKVETAEQFAASLADGFDLFQGFFFAQPQLLRSRRPITSAHGVLRLLALIEQDVDLDALADELRRHPNLTAQLLRLVQSSAAGLRRKIDSISSAIQLVGTRQIGRLAQLLLYARDPQRPPALRDPLLQHVGTRARTMELLALDWLPGDDRLGERAFMAGILSKIDTLLGMPLAEALNDLPLSAELRDAVLERSGKLGLLLRLCEARDRHDRDAIRRACMELDGISPAAVARAETDAAAWTLLISSPANR